MTIIKVSDKITVTGNVEYIRKDALLEWAKEKIKLIWHRPEDADEVADRVCAFQEIINYLNQL